jgi:carbonic anhydrase
MITGLEGLGRLREGNARFVANQMRTLEHAHESRRAELVSGQAPFAIVLGCSDSRVPAELVFDQGFGDLFVIRVAGNIVAPSQVGSVEFAAERYGTSLVVVMGHSQCGAILATLEELTGGAASVRQPALDRSRPSVRFHGIAAARANQRSSAWLSRERAASVDHLRHGSALLERLIERNGLLIVGRVFPRDRRRRLLRRSGSVGVSGAAGRGRGARDSVRGPLARSFQVSSTQRHSPVGILPPNGRCSLSIVCGFRQAIYGRLGR